MATQPQGDQIEVYDEVQATPAQPQTGFTYQKLVEMFPEEDRVRREIIDGNLFVTPPPMLPHQAVAMELSGRLLSSFVRSAGSASANRHSYGDRAAIV